MIYRVNKQNAQEGKLAEFFFFINENKKDLKAPPILKCVSHPESLPQEHQSWKGPTAIFTYYDTF